MLIVPGTQGGSDYSPVSFNPQTGLVYIGATNINSAFAISREKIDETNGPG